jgi:hypothetical protein
VLVEHKAASLSGGVWAWPSGICNKTTGNQGSTLLNSDTDTDIVFYQQQRKTEEKQNKTKRKTPLWLNSVHMVLSKTKREAESRKPAINFISSMVALGPQIELQEHTAARTHAACLKGALHVQYR